MSFRHTLLFMSEKSPQDEGKAGFFCWYFDFLFLLVGGILLHLVCARILLLLLIGNTWSMIQQLNNHSLWRRKFGCNHHLQSLGILLLFDIVFLFVVHGGSFQTICSWVSVSKSTTIGVMILTLMLMMMMMMPTAWRESAVKLQKESAVDSYIQQRWWSSNGNHHHCHCLPCLSINKKLQWIPAPGISTLACGVKTEHWMNPHCRQVMTRLCCAVAFNRHQPRFQASGAGSPSANKNNTPDWIKDQELTARAQFDPAE